MADYCVEQNIQKHHPESAFELFKNNVVKKSNNKSAPDLPGPMCGAHYQPHSLLNKYSFMLK